MKNGRRRTGKRKKEFEEWKREEKNMKSGRRVKTGMRRNMKNGKSGRGENVKRGRKRRIGKRRRI